MCIKCEAKKAALAILGLEVKKTLIGKVESGLILSLNLAENDLDKIKADTEAQLQVLVMKGATKEEAAEDLTAKYGEAFNTAAQKVEDCWTAIYKAVGIEDQEGDFTINQRTGEMYKEEVVPVADAQGVH